MKKRMINDILLVTVMLAVALLAFLLWQRDSRQGTQAVVRRNGEVVARYSLMEDGIISLCDGGNVLVIQDGKAWMDAADCPDRICVRQGKISRTGEVITCLPHRLTVTIEGESEDVDLISGGGG